MGLLRQSRSPRNIYIVEVALPTCGNATSCFYGLVIIAWRMQSVKFLDSFVIKNAMEGIFCDKSVADGDND